MFASQFWVAMQLHFLQIGQSAQLRRDLSGQLIVGDVKHSEIGELTEGRRDIPSQLIAAEKKLFQLG